MKAISLYQPWSSLIAYGLKTIETRSWAYGGDMPVEIAIHATKVIPSEAYLLVNDYCYFHDALAKIGLTLNELPTGCVLATATLVTCVATESVDNVSDQEAAFGDFAAGRWAWILRDVKQMTEPVPARGYPGIWEWRKETADEHTI